MQSWVTTMKNAGWPTIVCTPATRDDAAWSGAKDTQRQSLNASVIAGDTGADAVFDMASLPCFVDPNDLVFYQPDKLHWTNASYAQVAAGIQPVVLSL
jgi:hypothetical protein